ncbi:hypothetical protein DM02DRAFT_607143 [Periconia macrospinosa]|uniref:NB-ARC domain-containing protein n=1 Tax=Periconia macrospinosa TaxID=97972 RepID=A0A2V1CYJ8_9PLEO|nr:hypothetical protein DM02DRAFT_607143 [Periconia macrospinosa]
MDPRQLFFAISPSVSPDFVDRPRLFAWISDHCAQVGIWVALVGPSGMGKSQLAIKYAHHVLNAEVPPLVFWVYANTQTRFEEGYRGIAERLRLPGRDNPKVDVLRLVSDWLCDKRNGQWMMVLDDVDGEKVFSPPKQQEHDSLSEILAAYVPQSCNGSVLITSRNMTVAAQLVGCDNNIKEITVMEEDEALQLLGRKLQAEKLQRTDKDSAMELVNALDRLPLAIDQAASYINQQADMTVPDYFRGFLATKCAGDTSGLWQDKNVPMSAVTTWQMLLEHIQQKQPLAAGLLSLMSFFDRHGMPKQLLRRYSTAIGAGAMGTEEMSFDRDLNTLYASSLVTITPGVETCGMHALTQLCMRVWLSSSGSAKRYEQNFIMLLAKEFPVAACQAETQARKTCQLLLPHIFSLYRKGPLPNRSMAHVWAQSLINAGYYLHEVRGRHEEARKLLQRTTETCDKQLGMQHPTSLVSVLCLARVLLSQGKYSQAEVLSWQALEGLERKFGTEHLATSTSMSSLAIALYSQGKYEEAHKLNWQAAEARPEILTTTTALANWLFRKGEYNEAERLTRLAIEGWEKLLKAQRLDMSISAPGIAYLLHVANGHAEVARAYDEFADKLGAQHSSTVACRQRSSMLLKLTFQLLRAVIRGIVV